MVTLNDSMMEQQDCESTHDDYIATELLRELKVENSRKSDLIKSMQKHNMRERFMFVVLIAGIVAAFLWYLNQYDFSSTTTTSTTNSAEGVYAVVDSEGNVIASDLTLDDLTKVAEEVMADGDGEQDDHEDSNS